MTPPLRKTKSTLLTLEETERAAEGIKLLARSMGYTKHTDLHTALAAAGYPGSYATFGRLMNAARPAQEAELSAIARFFNVLPRDLTGAAVNPMKDPAPPRLVEYDLPAPEAATLPRVMAAVADAAKPLPVGRRPKAAALDPGQVQALADSIAELTGAIREFTAASAAKRTPLQKVS